MVELRPVDESLFAWAQQGDFGFLVEHELLPAFDTDVSHRLAPLEPYSKDYESDLEDYRDYLDAPDKALLAAVVEGKWAGYLAISCHWNGFALVEDLAVERTMRRHGVAHVLMDAAVAWARRQGLAGVTLETQSNNVAACLFYQRYGFRLEGIDRFLYRGLSPQTREIALFWYLPFEDVPR
ncbi:GNAT family N-acetyltransferase [Pseudomonas indica]|jgi:ribosomal protein S18 acetylase RimI-like enzyme|uniref:GNAT family N-acetyltransferase n=1 Tax=Pseudomonas indica TaxID=137658 RepID=UPI003FCF6FD5